jgi:[ribosomal protein S18]-alanine N-acetyltransferase
VLEDEAIDRMPDRVNIRHATSAHLPIIMRLERASDTAAHWSEQQYRQAIDAGEAQRLVLVLEDAAAPGKILGFLVARQIAPEWELENIVVAAEVRRNGLGKRLLEGLLKHARDRNTTRVFLEVRESNRSARALYQQAGFKQTGRRKSYYINPLEDAFLYEFKLS